MDWQNSAFALQGEGRPDGGGAGVERELSLSTGSTCSSSACPCCRSTAPALHATVAAPDLRGYAALLPLLFFNSTLGPGAGLESLLRHLVYLLSCFLTQTASLSTQDNLTYPTAGGRFRIVCPTQPVPTHQPRQALN